MDDQLSNSTDAPFRGIWRRSMGYRNVGKHSTLIRPARKRRRSEAENPERKAVLQSDGCSGLEPTCQHQLYSWAHDKSDANISSFERLHKSDLGEISIRGCPEGSWGPQQRTEHTHSAAFADILRNLEPPKLRCEKGSLVERLMEDFWVRFESELSKNLRQHGAPATSNSSSDSGLTSKGSSQLGSTKRRRKTSDGQEENDDQERGHKRPNNNETAPDMSERQERFACPYRKHNPKKYGLEGWGPCVLTGHQDMSRVKGHLYRYHLIHMCQRCKGVFESEELLDQHIEGVEGCQSNASIQAVEGIDRRLEAQLRCRKKTFAGQTQADRWKEMYQILFPGEAVPSPYFEPIADHQDLGNYELYLRQEVPRLFRMSLENTLSMETQAMEERLRDQITTLLEEAQDQAFSNYRATPYHLQYAASSLSKPQRPADMASDQSTGNTQAWSEPNILNQASYMGATQIFPEHDMFGQIAHHIHPPSFNLNQGERSMAHNGSSECAHTSNDTISNSTRSGSFSQTDTSASSVSQAQETSRYELTPLQNMQRFLSNEGSTLSTTNSQIMEEDDFFLSDDHYWASEGGERT